MDNKKLKEIKIASVTKLQEQQEQVSFPAEIVQGYIQNSSNFQGYLLSGTAPSGCFRTN